eukprot:TRINITY_DN58732_c0_g1_i1.p1 TRINITY_DN58732_c0_g1~~TRINITY_DN58732_c0_g1_i1.p1  ORF type:complete len:440 (+),score=44.54 TRINITY_DN58732_c0_g1_i1:34-1320(+)
MVAFLSFLSLCFHIGFVWEKVMGSRADSNQQVSWWTAPRRAIPAGYKRLSEILDELRNIAAIKPDEAEVVDLSQRFASGRLTSGGQRIYGLKISDNVGVDEDEPNVLIVSAHHSRELVTPEVALGIARRLLESNASSERNAVAQFQTWIIPVLNVDGYNYVFEKDRMWRKNRRLLPDGSVGVDLNRNYGKGWADRCGGSTRSRSNTYRGPFVASEVEVDLIVRMSQALGFERVLDFHSSGREVLVGYACLPMSSPLKRLVVYHGLRLARAARYSIRPPSADGEHQIYQIGSTTAYAFLVETATSFQPPHSEALAEVQRVLPLARAFFAAPVTVTGHVRCSSTGQPLPARVYWTRVKGRCCTSEPRFATASFGRFSLWLPSGKWKIVIKLRGYASLVTSTLVVKRSRKPVQLEVKMTPTKGGKRRHVPH